MNTKPFVVIDNEKCTGCGICADECAFEAIVVEDESARILETCTGCLCCVEICPNEALSESEDSPRLVIQRRNQLSNEQLLSAAFGLPFAQANNKKVER
jgi:MinD superfamily P-loop ATPase